MLYKKGIYIALVFICFLVYFNSLNNGFISDDIDTILNNRLISRSFSYLLYPSTLLNSLSYLLVKQNPFIYHLTNVILHSITTILVFVFLCLFFKIEHSLIASCLFAVHPIHTEAVSWISGRPYIITSLFILTGYFLYYFATSSINPFRIDTENSRPILRIDSRDIQFKPLPYLSCLLIFSYYMIRNFSFYFLFPFLLILSDVTFKRWRKNWKWWIPFLAIAAARIILATNLVSQRIADVRIDMGVSPVKNPIIFFLYSFFGHLSLLIWPDKLTFYHDPTIATQNLLTYSLLYFLPIIFLLLFTFKKAKMVFFAICLFILFLVPTYSPIPVACLVSERYVYIPSIGLSIFAAFLYEKYTDRFPRYKKYFLALSVLAIVAYAARTLIRNEDWKSPALFWRKTLEVSPHSPRAHNNMGTVYIRERNFDKAIEEFEKAIELNPEYALGYFNLGDLYTLLGEKDKAINFYYKAIKLRPWYQNTYNNLGALYINLGNSKEAIPLLEKAIEIYPDFAPAHFNLSVAYYNQKEYGLAVKHCNIAAKLGFDIPPELSGLLEPYRK
jgi:tetratricopeptide (TPR) repeat protein